MSEPECSEGGGSWNGDTDTCDEMTGYTPKHNIDKVIEYDMSICEGSKGVCLVDNDGKPSGKNWTVVIHEDDGITLRDIRSHYIYLGELEKNKKMTVVQSYHMKSDTGNWAQGDKVTFDIELLALQLNASGPGNTTLLLENKTSSWDRIVDDGRYGILTYKTENDTFDYTFEGRGLEPGTGYSLIYYADPWPGSYPGAWIANFTADGSGNIVAATGSVDLGIDLPDPADQNAPAGAKIWLVLSDDYNNGSPTTGSMTAWNQGEYLYEYNLVKYDDTDN